MLALLGNNKVSRLERLECDAKHLKHWYQCGRNDPPCCGRRLNWSFILDVNKQLSIVLSLPFDHTPKCHPARCIFRAFAAHCSDKIVLDAKVDREGMGLLVEELI